MRVGFCLCTGLWALALILALVSCEREQRPFRVAPSAAKRGRAVRLGAWQLGSPLPAMPLPSPYENNAYAIAEGQRLYAWFNCVGCHAHGGGGIGPALMDAQWIHGSEPTTIFTVIVEGTPNGMPSFRGKIADPQVWQLVAYVRSLSGLVPKDAVPVRSDHMQVNTSAPPKTTTQAQALQELRTAEDAVLHSYGWVDRAAGIVRMPIDRAMEVLAERGLPTRAQPPESTVRPTAPEPSR
jgi:cytochrome c oxidase cbb3-type subunit III